MNRNEAYRALDDLITKGFLSMRVDLGGKILIFKTVNEREHQLVKLYAGAGSSPADIVRFNMHFLVFSLFSIDGESVLPDRERRLNELLGFFEAFPEKTCSALLTRAQKLMVSSYEASKYVEGFSYTDSSRIMWKVTNGVLPNDPALTGILGTERLGLNAHQENWVYINRMLDDEERNNSDFSMAILVASATNPKGAKQIRTKHDATMESSEVRRQKLAKEGWADPKGKWTSAGWAAPVDTADDLLAELDRQMRGVKDRHDIFMENYLKKIKQTAEARAKAAKDRIEEARKNLGDLPSITGEQRALSPKEINELYKRNKSKRNPGVVSVQSEETATDEDKERFINKIGSRVLTARK